MRPREVVVRSMVILAVTAGLGLAPRADGSSAAPATAARTATTKAVATPAAHATTRPATAAATPTASATDRAAAPSTRTRPATAGAPVKSRATSARTPASPSTRSAAAAGAPRRLEDINIEGEITVPQVLFITARDQRRFVDFQHRSYLRTSLQLGDSTRFPSWIAVMPGAKPETQRKETSR